MDKEEYRFCSFCGKGYRTSMMLIGNDAMMCPECARMASRIVEEYREEKADDDADGTEDAKDFPAVKTPHEIKEFLDEYVIGQDTAKKRIAVAVYNHYKRIMKKQESSVEIDKSNCVIIGPTGSGKTEIVRTVARMLNVPFCIVDATVFTQAGYVGEDVESILSRLLQAADYDIERAQRGIVFIDEIDKITKKGDSPSITRDVSGEGVQQGLLKLLEGSIVNVPPQGGRKHPEQKMVQVDTRDILFICSGAFDGLDKKVEARLNKRSIGFISQSRREQIDKDDMMKHVTQQDLKKYGFIPELIGRLPVITYTEKLDKEALVKILTEPKNALTKQYCELLKLDGCDLKFGDGVLDYVVEKAIDLGTGARGLRNVMEDIMNQVMYDVPTEKCEDFTITIEYAKKAYGEDKEAA